MNTLTLSALIGKLADLIDKEYPELNALGEDPVVIRIDLGDEQHFEVSHVTVEDSAYDPIIVIHAGNPT